MELGWVRLRRGEFGPIPTPEEASAYRYSAEERAIVENYRALVYVGVPAVVRTRIEALVKETGADEMMITTTVHRREERLRSFELMAEEMLQTPLRQLAERR
jgi:alkanesulfonate monooxygenase SsuD/methylene tetrahydromethanopterin reductase-like flavin-dependent oxidoreductase (luciferase family)